MMCHNKSLLVFMLVLLALPCTVAASNTVLSAVFDGSEASLEPLPGTCGGDEPLRYQLVTDLRVTADGSYVVSDAFSFTGTDISAQIYEESFNPDSPEKRLLTPDGIDIRGEVALEAGTVYVLLVQHRCNNREGAWALGFSGPGAVTSAAVVAVPDDFEGVFSADDPIASSDCGSSQFHQSGPVRVSKSGTHYYSDMSIHFAVDMCLQVYTQPFDANNPDANRVGEALDDFGALELQAGQDYYFVAQPWQGPREGEFFYTIAPPAPFRINKALAGSWYYPPTNGQGFFIDVFDDSNQMFLAWFTYDLERPDADASTIIGEPGHRWLTALGPFDGDTASLVIYTASGMVFDSPAPPVSQKEDGTMTVKFSNCTEGMVDYDLDSADVMGQIPIEPLALDLVTLCKSLVEGPGRPGPL